MGWYIGVKIYKLVGLFILIKLAFLKNKANKSL